MIQIDREESEEEIQRRRTALQKNNEKLDEICHTICLVMGWSLVLGLIIYAIYLRLIT
jgi:hypothetical protein